MSGYDLDVWEFFEQLFWGGFGFEILSVSFSESGEDILRMKKRHLGHRKIRTFRSLENFEAVRHF